MIFIFLVSKQFQGLVSKNAVPVNIQRWYSFILAQRAVQISLNQLTPAQKAALITQDKSSNGSQENGNVTASGRAKEGKFVELPGAEMGKVVVRFPPEASG